MYVYDSFLHYYSSHLKSINGEEYLCTHAQLTHFSNLDKVLLQFRKGPLAAGY